MCTVKSLLLFGADFGAKTFGGERARKLTSALF